MNESDYEKNIFVLRLLNFLFFALAIASLFIGMNIEKQKYMSVAVGEFLNESCPTGYYVGCIEEGTTLYNNPSAIIEIENNLNG